MAISGSVGATLRSFGTPALAMCCAAIRVRKRDNQDTISGRLWASGSVGGGGSALMSPQAGGASRVPGRHITDRQMRLYMSLRSTHSPAVAAAKSGFSTAAAYRIEADPRPPAERRKARERRRPDPLAGVREDEILPMLKAAPGLRPVAIFEEVLRRRPEMGAGVRRTLERRIRSWRALNGTEKEVIFRQEQPGIEAKPSDYTDLAAGRVEQIDGGEAASATTTMRRPAGDLQHHLPRPVSQRFVPAAALARLALGGGQHRQERKRPHPVRPGHRHEKHR